MLTVNVLCVGTLKEQYLRDAIGEYSKRIGGYARLVIKETKNDRELIPTDRFVKKIDQGQNDFSFRLTVAKTCDIGGLSQIFNQKPYAVNAFPLLDNPIEKYGGAVNIENSAITLEAFKMADSQSGYVLRLFNNTDSVQKTAVAIGGYIATVQFAGYEVKNLLLNK